MSWKEVRPKTLWSTCTGIENMMAGVEEALAGKQEGDALNVTLPPEARLWVGEGKCHPASTD